MSGGWGILAEPVIRNEKSKCFLLYLNRKADGEFAHDTHVRFASRLLPKRAVLISSVGPRRKERWIFGDGGGTILETWFYKGWFGVLM